MNIIKVDNKIPLIDGKAIEASGGITPSGSISITENGTYDVTEKAEAVVNVSGGGDYFEATYTHAEDWLTDTKGNALNIFRTYAPLNGAAIVAATIDLVGNQATGNYAAISEAAIDNGEHVGGWATRANGTAYSIASSRSMYLTAGTTVIVKGWRRVE